MDRPTLTATDSGITKLKNYITNSVYKIGGLFSSRQKNETIVLFGRQYRREEGLDVFKKTIWLTYRTDFPLLKGKIQSDVGWGCMIRAGQMILAEALRKHSGADSPQELLSIVSAFLDDDEEKNSCFNYSIQKIVKVCQSQWGLVPGSWLSVCNISHILHSLHSIKPLRGYEQMKILVNSDSSLFYEQLLLGLNRKLCKCRREMAIQKFICPKCHNIKHNESMLLIIITRMGVKKPQSEYFQMLKDVFNLKQSIGAIGGKPGKALYLLGVDGEEFPYLDPHYVQPSSNRKNMDSLINTYFCDSYRTVKFDSLDPSIGLGFFLSGPQDIQDFIINIENLKAKYGKYFFIYVQPVCPDYAKEDQVTVTSTKVYDHRNSTDWKFTNSFQCDLNSLQ